MNRETLVKLQILIDDLLEQEELPVTCSGLAHALDKILSQFTEFVASFELFGACLDDLARHVGYQLEAQAESDCTTCRWFKAFQCSHPDWKLGETCKLHEKKTLNPEG